MAVKSPFLRYWFWQLFAASGFSIPAGGSARDMPLDHAAILLSVLQLQVTL
jgi:hypothetical protein